MMKAHPGLEELVGREVSSVEFVRGYVQIRFDGPCLTAYTMPTIRTEFGEVLDPSSVGYADALVKFIGKTVEAAYQRDNAIELRFAGGAGLTVSLRDTDRRVDEAATLTTDGKSIWSW